MPVRLPAQGRQSGVAYGLLSGDMQEVVAHFRRVGDAAQQRRKAQAFSLRENRRRLAVTAQVIPGGGVDFEDSDIWDMQVHRVLLKTGSVCHGAWEAPIVSKIFFRWY
jgi:hypothetical protein